MVRTDCKKDEDRFNGLNRPKKKVVMGGYRAFTPHFEILQMNF